MTMTTRTSWSVVLGESEEFDPFTSRLLPLKPAWFHILLALSQGRERAFQALFLEVPVSAAGFVLAAADSTAEGLDSAALSAAAGAGR